ncbi:MAG: serine/threonine protein kinase [Bacteroidetes bacterium]|nr:serine/threonine protein kinase [Bacteroidota bacterium]
MSLCEISVTSSERGFRFRDAGRREYTPEDLLGSDIEGRPVLDLSAIARDADRVEEVLCSLGFSAEALTRIYLHLEKGNWERGRALFIKRLADRGITVERAGFSKKGEHQAKFYIVLGGRQAEGSFKVFYHGYSRQGTPRAINKVKDAEVSDVPLAPQEISRKDQVNGHICRWMGWEAGIRIDELGGEDLSQLDISKLSDQERWTLYRSLIEGLALFAQDEWVHRDVKAKNIVVIRNEEAQVTGVKFIDLDFLGENKTLRKWSGTDRYVSADLRSAYLKAQQSRPHCYALDVQDDLWAGMWVIYELEKKLPSQQRWINPEIIARGDRYFRIWEGTRCSEKDSRKKRIQRYEQFDEAIHREFSEGGLFSGIDPERPLDPLMIALGAWHNEDRPVAGAILESWDSVVPEYPLPPEELNETQEEIAADRRVEGGWRNRLRSFWKGFVAFWCRCFCCATASGDAL